MEQLYNFEKLLDFQKELAPTKILSKLERTNRKQQLFDQALVESLREQIDAIEIYSVLDAESDELIDNVLPDIRYMDAEKLKKYLMN